jgi:hypothetical protein
MKNNNLPLETKMTIYERVLESQKKAAMRRLDAINSGTPECIIEALDKLIDQLDSGICEVKGIEEFGKLEIADAVQKTGRMGKPFAEITTTCGRKIFYFPIGKWGPFLKEFTEPGETK